MLPISPVQMRIESSVPVTGVNSAPVGVWMMAPSLISNWSRITLVYMAVPPPRFDSRKLWIAFAQAPRGIVVVDAGAKRALVEGGRSLLPAGVVEHRGAFALGDAVEVAGPDGVVFAKGLINYASDEIDHVRGRSIREGGREIIHRDSLVIL